MFLSLFGAVLALGLGGTASATAMPEMVVTARRVEEPLSTLPVSATVFDAASIKQLGASSLDEISRYTPGFLFDSATGRGPNSNRPTIRGLTTIRNGIANSTVAATFIDGVYLGGSIQSTELFDLERIEILRGPQAAQYGRATYAGAINYITRRPTSELTAEGSVTGAEHDTWRANGLVSGPLAGDRLRFLVAAGYDTYGGEYRNTVDDSVIGGQESREAMLKLEALPIDNLVATLRLGMQTTDDQHFPMWLQPRTANNCCFRTADAPRAREYFDGEAWTSDEVTLWTNALAEAGGSGYRLDRLLGSLTINWTAPNGLTWSSLTGGDRDEIKRGFDASYAAYDPVPPLPGSFLQRDKIDQRDFSQEFRVTSDRAQPLRWLGGLYYYKGSKDDVYENRVVVAPDGSVAVLPNYGDLQNDTVKNRAVFGGLEIDLPREVTTGLELRYSSDEVEVGTVPNPGAAGQPQHFSETFYNLSPRLTVSWRATDTLMPYANIARGNSPGTFNPTVPALAGGAPDESYRDVGEEVIWNYELGLRGELPEQRAAFALAAYYLDVDDQQFTTVVELPDGRTASLLDNVGHSRVIGLELETSAQFTDELAGRLTYSWTDSEIRSQTSEEYADLRGSNGTFEEAEELGDLEGNDTPRVPEHMVSLMLEYRRPLRADIDWFAGSDYNFQTSRFAQDDNLLESGDRHLLGLHAGIAWNQAELRLWVDNLTDDDTPVDMQRYIDSRSGRLPTCQSFVTAGTAPPGTQCAGSSTTPRGFAISLPEGRQAGATLSYRF